MENLNDLIWTDEDCNENGDVSTQESEMHRACMIVFCGHGSSTKNPPPYVDPVSDMYAC